MKWSSSVTTPILLTIAIVLLAIAEVITVATLSLSYEFRLATGAAISGLIVFTIYRSPKS
jgi:hypothetical protein